MCGIFGIVDDEPVAESVYYGIVKMQHRGQDAAGIYCYDPISKMHALHKDKGLVSQVFTTDTLPLPHATWGIGHVRYSTIGTGSVIDTQPLCHEGVFRTALVLNGNITNYVPWKSVLEDKGALFETECDAEALLHQFVQHLPGEGFEAVCQAAGSVMENACGAYSVVGIIDGVGLFAFRDPNGIRPLLYGKKKGARGHAFASETLSLLALGFEDIEDVKPGEVVFIDKEHKLHRRSLKQVQPAPCAFEFNYFSKPNNILHQKEVYRVRKRLGQALAGRVAEAGIELDAVVPIPSTSRPSAIALAKELKVPYEEGFVKQDYIGRTFIMSTQVVRQKALSTKLSFVPSVFKGKSVLLVDDSIVRGTVSKRAVQLARKAGALKVYFASTFPPIRHPCLYGIDFPEEEQLIAAAKNLDEIKEAIGADGLFYNTVQDLKQAIGLEGLCTACLTGNYPTAMKGADALQALRRKDIQEMEFSCSS